MPCKLLFSGETEASGFLVFGKAREGGRLQSVIYRGWFVSEAPSCWKQTCSGDCVWHGKGVVLPSETVAGNGGAHIYHQYTIRVKNRDSLLKALVMLDW